MFVWRNCCFFSSVDFIDCLVSHNHTQQIMSTSVRRRLWSPFINYKRHKGATWNKFPSWFPTTPADKLIPALPEDVRVLRKPRHFNGMWEKGYDARMMHLAEKTSLLMKYERVEMTYQAAEEVRAYVERLIATAIRYGDCHSPTMELADFWLQVSLLVCDSRDNRFMSLFLCHRKRVSFTNCLKSWCLDI